MLKASPKVKDKAAMQQLVNELSVDKIKQWNKGLVTQEVNSTLYQSSSLKSVMT